MCCRYIHENGKICCLITKNNRISNRKKNTADLQPKIKCKNRFTLEIRQFS